tara:strand:+ start:169 stop:999 length:831 start_codon:yes stop_codon:yes gene_type:complete
MEELLSDLSRVLDLEPIEVNLYRGVNEYREYKRLFGGQVLAQALSAAYRTVENQRICHSLHGYFLRPGDTEHPVIYQVDSIRTGKSFTTRSVKAIQKGEAIFSMDASFQSIEDGLSHQVDLDQVFPRAEELEDDHEVAKRKGKATHWSHRKRPFEVRTIKITQGDRGASWIRYRHETKSKGNPQHQFLLSYASDMGLISTAMLPHKDTASENMHIASLDHAIWFHRTFSVSDWILFVRETPAAAGARGFTRGAFYSTEGEILASVMQEGLIRVRPQ